jgi:hypothetical protein
LHQLRETTFFVRLYQRPSNINEWGAFEFVKMHVIIGKLRVEAKKWWQKIGRIKIENAAN